MTLADPHVPIEDSLEAPRLVGSERLEELARDDHVDEVGRPAGIIEKRG